MPTSNVSFWVPHPVLNSILCTIPDEKKAPSKFMKAFLLTDGQLDPGRGISNVSMVITRVCARRGCLNMTLAEEFQILE